MKEYKLKSMIQYDNNIHIFLKNHPAILSHNKIKNHFLSSSFLIKNAGEVKIKRSSSISFNSFFNS